ncbi:MAG TPA: response regulator [Chloroflexota bacterium]|nr:response regulator [Chloroflexota bacterium]
MAVDPLTPTLPGRPLRVLVIDAHPAVGHGLVGLLGIMPGVQVCALATRREDGLLCAGQTRPDVVLVDAELPGGAALSTARQLRGCLPAARVVALGLYPDRRAAMLAAGAHAFVLKDAGFEALYAAIVAGHLSTSTCATDGDSASARTPGSVRSS